MPATIVNDQSGLFALPCSLTTKQNRVKEPRTNKKWAFLIMLIWWQDTTFWHPQIQMNHFHFYTICVKFRYLMLEKDFMKHQKWEMVKFLYLIRSSYKIVIKTDRICYRDTILYILYFVIIDIQYFPHFNSCLLLSIEHWPRLWVLFKLDQVWDCRDRHSPWQPWFITF